MESKLWSLILAGGSGKRLADVTGGVPKQFWRPHGGPSLLENTLLRLATVTPPDRCVIVIDDTHWDYISRSAPAAKARIVAQPHDRGTAAGVLYGLVSILSTDPDAVVLITPADHGVVNPSAFLSTIRKAVRHVATNDGVILLGVAPSMAHTDHGWMALGPGGSPAGLRRVAKFFEKPGLETARQLLKLGALVNTMVIASRARTLLHVCRERVPDMTEPFVGALTLPPEIRDASVRAKYPGLPTYDFSRHVLTGAAGLLVSRVPEEAGWSDLGTPDRVARWLATRHESSQASPQRRRVTSTVPAESLRL